jgi:hypothetical protein
MIRKYLLVIFKVTFALLALFALGQEIAALINRDAFNLVTFYSYFTNQSNTFAAIMLLVSAYFVAKGVKSSKLVMLRGGASLYLILTGVVFTFILAGDDPTQWTEVPIDNTILHNIMPIALALDWLLDPPAKSVAYKRALLWLIYPLLYAATSLVRGSMSGFYPYPFFNSENGGYGMVFAYVVGIALFVAAMAFILTRIPIKSTRHKKSRA